MALIEYNDNKKAERINLIGKEADNICIFFLNANDEWQIVNMIQADKFNAFMEIIELTLLRLRLERLTRTQDVKIKD